MTENAKYALVESDTVERDGVTLKRVRALVDFQAPKTYADPTLKIVKAGDLGGYIQSESNLQQKGNAWVGNGVYVWGGASVIDDAFVRTENGGIVEISDTAIIGGNAEVIGIPVVKEDHTDKYTIINGNAAVAGKVTLMGANIAGNGAGLDGYLSFVGSYDLSNVRLSGCAYSGNEIVTRARWLPENAHWHSWKPYTSNPNSDLVKLNNKNIQNNFYNVDTDWCLYGSEDERQADFYNEVEQRFCAGVLAVGCVEDVAAFKQTPHSRKYFADVVPEYWFPTAAEFGKLWGVMTWQREAMEAIDDEWANKEATRHTQVLNVCSHCANEIDDPVEYPTYTLKSDGFTCPHCGTTHERTWDNWLANIRKRDAALGEKSIVAMEEKYLAIFEQWQNAPTPENENALVSLFNALGLSEIHLYDETDKNAERDAAIRYGFSTWALRKNAQYPEYWGKSKQS